MIISISVYKRPSSSICVLFVQTLVDNKILSALVYEEETSSYVGFLDVRDLVKFAVFGADTQNTTSTFHEVVQHGIKAIDQFHLRCEYRQYGPRVHAHEHNCRYMQQYARIYTHVLMPWDLFAR